MPRLADFVVIQDHGVDIPHDGINDWHFRPFSAPGVLGTPSILMFRLQVTDEVEFASNLNNVELFRRKLPAGSDRTWHETITQLNVLQTDNQLDMIVYEGSGTVTVSDIVLFYQAVS
jgi:hypothetical protein